MAKTKHGWHTEKVKPIKQPKVSNGMNEVPGAYKKTDKKASGNYLALASNKNIKWN
ncbi:MAG: hypothetical protein ACRDB0_01665 [Paraclostridium sp.]